MSEKNKFVNEQEEREHFDKLDVSQLDYEKLPEEMKIQRQFYRPAPSLQEKFLETVENISYLQGALRNEKDYTQRLMKIMREIEEIRDSVTKESLSK